MSGNVVGIPMRYDLHGAQRARLEVPAGVVAEHAAAHAAQRQPQPHTDALQPVHVAAALAHRVFWQDKGNESIFLMS